MRREGIVGLDIVRFFAAVAVALFHLAYWISIPDTTPSRVAGHVVDMGAIGHIFRSGWVGVEIFFVLSGFVIAYSANGKSPLAFLKSRFLRLYPSAWISCSITAMVLVAMAIFPIGRIAVLWLKTMVLYPSAPWVDGAYWTLGVEMMFYALIFVLLCTNFFRRIDIVMFSISVLSGLIMVAA
jgi:peptidoglycan/LPS O-acetylase OafA/YrhL